MIYQAQIFKIKSEKVCFVLSHREYLISGSKAQVVRII